jgi:hypothetical protein
VALLRDVKVLTWCEGVATRNCSRRIEAGDAALEIFKSSAIRNRIVDELLGYLQVMSMEASIKDAVVALKEGYRGGD